ncbi:MAG: tRNA uridine-5-carboxymethylaminomethyl(34) synthesis GTPase MnmE [Candidatus Marinimicrobia bacterium]|nr:tRNA uridine-5-carboxymethylaminomethyl(34) synthesis GTPase MnmE [Candidatus Neomarinimicrobiota bacterium]
MPTMSSNVGGPTVVAQATPPGISALAIVRLTGSKSLDIASLLSKKPFSSFKPGHTLLTYLYNSSGQPLDQVVITYYKAPNSYTGEDVVDISCHGGVSVPKSIITASIACGAVPAPPGEFTKRAFINGKLDLSQAEAVADIIRAKTERSQRVGVAALVGLLSNEITSLRDTLVSIIGKMEVELDFIDHEPSLARPVEWTNKLVLLRGALSSLLNTFSGGRVFRDGAQVVITGNPNVGKSSLLNALVKEERVIVSGKPGTTTDAVDVHYDMCGVPVSFVDTAGIRKPNNSIESAGIDIAKNYLASASLVLWVWSVDSLPNNINSILSSPVFSAPFLVVINKSDLMHKNIPIELSSNNTYKHVLVSVKSGHNVSTLLSSIKESLTKDFSTDQPLLTNKRHEASIGSSINSLDCALSAAKDGEPIELLLSDLRVALSHLDTILGITTPDHIINSVFDQFCVGK